MQKQVHIITLERTENLYLSKSIWREYNYVIITYTHNSIFFFLVLSFFLEGNNNKSSFVFFQGHRIKICSLNLLDNCVPFKLCGIYITKQNQAFSFLLYIFLPFWNVWYTVDWKIIYAAVIFQAALLQCFIYHGNTNVMFHLGFSICRTCTAFRLVVFQHYVYTFRVE